MWFAQYSRCLIFRSHARTIPGPPPIRRYAERVGETQKVTAIPDLRAVRIDDMPLTPAALDEVLQRVLPGRPVVTITLGAAFASGI